MVMAEATERLHSVMMLGRLVVDPGSQLASTLYPTADSWAQLKALPWVCTGSNCERCPVHLPLALLAGKACRTSSAPPAESLLIDERAAGPC